VSKEIELGKSVLDLVYDETYPIEKDVVFIKKPRKKPFSIPGYFAINRDPYSGDHEWIGPYKTKKMAVKKLLECLDDRFRFESYHDSGRTPGSYTVGNPRFHGVIEDPLE